MARPTPKPSHSHPPPPPSSSISEDGGASKALDDSDTPTLDVSILKEIAKRQLIDTLNSVNGAKTLVLDPSLAGPLGLVTEVSLLKHHGVDKMFWLEQGPINATTRNIVYLCRPHIKWMKIVADQIKRLSATPTSTHTYTLVLVPRRTTLCDRILEEEGVFGEVTILSYKLEFIPLENDLVSLEYENVFKEVWMDGDETSIYYAARALITIQQAYGLFPRIVGKGDAAKKLANLLLHLRAHPPTNSTSSTPTNGMLSLTTPSEIIDSLIIIDRNTDMITPMLTQLTYEGLIDEFMGIKNSHVEIDATLLSPPNPSLTPSAGSSSAAAANLATTSVSPKKKKHHLTSSDDSLYGELRDMNFAVVGVKLNKEARRLDAEYKGRHQAQTVTQLREFVGKLGGLQNEHQALRLHTGLSESIAKLTHSEIFNKGLEIQQNLIASYDTAAQISSIEDLIAQQAPAQLVLRLLCLASLTAGGIKTKVLENLKKEILQTYGYHLLPLLLSLTSLSLLLPTPLPKPRQPHHSHVSSTYATPTSPSAPFLPIRKSLRLMSDTNESNPADISYVYSGYAPLSIRLVQCVAQKGLALAPLGAASANNAEGNVGGAVPTGQGAAQGSEGTGGPSAGTAGIGKVDKIAAHPILGWKGFEEVIKLIPGEVVDEVQSGKEVVATMLPGAQLLPRDRTTTTVVFFLGGCTYTEVACLRWMTKHSKGRRFLVATTGMISGTSFMESLAPPGVKLGSAAGM